jgi:hypothetical protein
MSAPPNAYRAWAEQQGLFAAPKPVKEAWPKAPMRIYPPLLPDPVVVLTTRDGTSYRLRQWNSDVIGRQQTYIDYQPRGQIWQGLYGPFPSPDAAEQWLGDRLEFLGAI